MVKRKGRNEHGTVDCVSLILCSAHPFRQTQTQAIQYWMAYQLM